MVPRDKGRKIAWAEDVGRGGRRDGDEDQVRETGGGDGHAMWPIFVQIHVGSDLSLFDPRLFSSMFVQISLCSSRKINLYSDR